MKMKDKLNEIENLLCDLYNNYVDLDDALLTKYENSVVPDEQYLNDVGLLKYWNKTICEFLGNKRFSGQ